MKTSKLFKLLLGLVLLGALAGCGSDKNKSDANGIVTNPISPNFQGSTQQLSDVRSRVYANQFYNPSFPQNINVVTQNFTINNTVNQPDCDTKWIFTYCSYSNTSNALNYTTQTVASYLSTDNNRLQNLKNIVDGKLGSILSIRMDNIGGYEILLDNGASYTIHFNFPMVANPVQQINSSRTSGSFTSRFY